MELFITLSTHYYLSISISPHLMDSVDKKQQYISVGILGVCFMLMFTAYNSLQNMISSIYSQMGYKSLGQISVFCIYGSFGIANFFAAYVIERVSYRKLMFFCSVGYTLFNMTGMYVTACNGQTEGICVRGLIYAVVIFFALITGICASFIWVAQAAYVSDVSTSTTKGQLFGLFWGLMMTSQIVGNILSTFILGKISNMVYFIVLAIVGMTGALMFFFVRPTGKESHQTKAPLSLKQRFSQMKQLIFQQGTLPQKLYYTFAGVTVACYAGFVYKLINRSFKQQDGQNEDQFKKDLAFHTGLVFIALGVSQVSTGLIMNRVGDMFNRYRMASFGTVIVEVAVIVSLLTYFLQSYGMCFVVSILWGGAEAYLQANTGAMISSQYEGRVTAFSVFRAFFAIGVTSIMLINIIFTLTDVPDWVFIIVVAVYQMIVTIASQQLQKRAIIRKKGSILNEDTD